jgi:hypothetical protein
MSATFREDSSADDAARACEAAKLGPRRRSSTQVKLVLVGAASLVSCGEPASNQMAQRDVYEHRSQCVQDWNEEKKCELVTQGPHRGYWYGPGYVGTRYAPSSTTQRVGTTVEPSGGKSASSSSHVSRSGFGSSASSRSSSS